MLFGLNHKTAPLSVREKLAHLCGTTLPEVEGAKLEAVPVFTCNRAEIYFSGMPGEARKSFVQYLAAGNLDYETLKNYFYELESEEVIKHLFAVASGLDSMIIGENQILHQIKESYNHSTTMGYVGKHLHSLFQKALEVGKRVRSETGISENRVSIASTAVDLARSIFGPLENSTALIIGAGEMANLVAVHLMESGVKKMLFVNRTLATAQQMAEKFSGGASHFDQLEEQIAKADMIISSTSAPHPIIREKLMAKIMPERLARPMFIIDIAVPRDVEPECGSIENLYLYDVDDLQNVVNENMAQRKIEAEKAQTIVNYEASQFQVTLQSFTVIPLIKALRTRAEEIRICEFEKFLQQNPELNDNLKNTFEQQSISMMNKWLHDQIIGLKNQGSADLDQLKLMAEVLGLPEDCLPKKPIRGLKEARKESA
jgi:glutamyl-tRNA reductase